MLCIALQTCHIPAAQESLAFMQSGCRRETSSLKLAKLRGCTFVNQYVVIKYLGRGACGRVFLCMDMTDNRLYAVKVMCSGCLVTACVPCVSRHVTMSSAVMLKFMNRHPRLHSLEHKLVCAYSCCIKQAGNLPLYGAHQG